MEGLGRCEDDSVGRASSVQEKEPEFRSPAPTQEKVRCSSRMFLEHGAGGQRQDSPGVHLPAGLDKSALDSVSINSTKPYKLLPLHVTCVHLRVHQHLIAYVYLWVRVEARATVGVTGSHGLVRSGHIPMDSDGGTQKVWAVLCLKL